jgi:hypothetical protein
MLYSIMLHLKNDRGYHKESNPVPIYFTLQYPTLIPHPPLHHSHNTNDSPSNHNTKLNHPPPRRSSPPSPRRRRRSSNLQPKRRCNHRTPIHRGGPHTRRRGLCRTPRPGCPRRRSAPWPSSPSRPVGRRTRRCAPPCGPGGGAPVAAGGPGGIGAVVGGAEGAGTVGTCACVRGVQWDELGIVDRINGGTYRPSGHRQVVHHALLDRPNLRLDPSRRLAMARRSVLMGFYRLIPTMRRLTTILRDQMLPMVDRRPRIRSMLVLA